jgi:single-stranded-DNA-specific exonuclease
VSPSIRIDACDEQAVTGLEESLGIPRLAARLLWLRGITTAARAEAFLFPKIEDLSDPLTLPDVEPALVRTAEAIRRHETVGIFGDYDADGISSAALMANFLKQLGVATETYIPRREEGYGLNLTAVRQLSQRGVSLLMCLDCGTSNPEEIDAARDLGMDTIVIDHHEVSADHADPLALVNPKRPDSRPGTSPPAA